MHDAIKALVYLAPLIYLILRKDELRLRWFWLFFAGLLILLLGHLLDFCDEIRALDKVFILGGADPRHDFFEDTVGFTLGFAIFILAIYLELKEKHKP